MLALPISTFTMCRAVDAIVPITRTFQMELNTLYKALHGTGRANQDFGMSQIKDLQRIYRQVIQIDQWLRYPRRGS
jgi:hypothetical protein